MQVNDATSNRFISFSCLSRHQSSDDARLRRLNAPMCLSAGTRASDNSSDGNEADGRFRNVGLRVWQCAFVLTEYLVRRAPLRQWAGVRVLDLGSGTGERAP